MKPLLALLLVAPFAWASPDVPVQTEANMPAGPDAGDLAKQLANPIANLISVPLQSNLDFGIGPANALRYTLNVQPVITPTKTTFSLSPELTYDWQSDQWLAPVNLVVSQLLKLGDQPVQVSLGGRYYFDHPRGGPEWGIRLNFTLLFPR